MFNNLIKRDENSKIVFSNKLIVVLVAAAAFFLFISGKTPDKKNPSDISVTESKSTEEKVINTEETEKNREPPARVPYGKTVTPDCFSYPPALFMQRDFAVCGPRRWALPLDPASLCKGSTETFI